MNQYFEPAQIYLARSTSRHNFIWRRLMLASVSALAVSTASTQVKAQCEPDPPEDGDEVVCEGVDDDGIEILGSNINLTILDDAIVTSDGQSSITLNGAGNEFFNFGVVTGNPDFFFSGVVRLSGDTLTTIGVNEGDISVFGSGVALELGPGVLSFVNRQGASIRSEGFLNAVEFSLAYRGSFTNSGLIRSEEGRAINAFTSSTVGTLNRLEVFNTSTGVIESINGIAISNFGGDFLDITNSGIIRGGGVAAVNIDEFSILRNEPGGLIEGTNGAAVSSSAFISGGRATISNSGILRGNGTSVTGDAYFLDNEGEIFGSIVGGIAEVENSGTIYGSVLLGTFSDSLENSGIIMGAVELGDGADVFRDFGGEIAGGVSLGSGDDFLLVRTGIARGNIPEIDPGDGLDSFGVSVDGVETIELVSIPNFEGIAIEARFADSEATLVAQLAAAYSQTLSAFGEGKIINLASISVVGGDAVRLFSNSQEFFSGSREFIESPFGSGVTFVNEGLISVSGGLAIRSLPDPGFFSEASGNERIENRGEISGDIFLGGGDDIFISAGTLNGDLDLGVGDDVFVIDTSTTLAGSNVSIIAGEGLDSFGFFTRSQAAISLGMRDGFEAAAVFADGIDAQIEIESGDNIITALRVYGTGTISNNTEIIGSANIDLPAVNLISDGVSFVNNAAIGGVESVRLSGDVQTFTNNANLIRNEAFGSLASSTGIISDTGFGNTIINNGDIIADVFSTSAVFINAEQASIFPINETDIISQLTTSFINNGTLRSAAEFGLVLSTDAAVIVENNGLIDDIVIDRSNRGVSIHNNASGSIGRIIAFESIFETSTGPVFLTNDGLISLNVSDDFCFDSDPCLVVNFNDAGGIGPLEGSIDDVIVNSGLIVGGVHLNSGADSFYIVDSGRVEGLVNGGFDVDTLFLTDFDGNVIIDNFINFERLDISTRNSAVISNNSGLSSSFTELFIRDGLTRLETNLSLGATILENGILGGGGAITGNVTNFGTIAPGASIGDLTINGDLTLAANSVLNIEFNDNASDTLTVLGDVLIDDAILEFTPLGNSVSSIQSFEFLNANTVMGEFSAISFNGFTGFADLTFIDGVLGVTITPQFEFSSSLTANSVSVAGYLNDLIISDAVNSNADDVISTLFSLSSDNVALNAAMLSLQPEAFAATAAISIENAFLINDTIRDRFRTDQNREDGKYFWLSGAGSFANYEGDLGGDGTSSFKTNSRSILGGAEIVRGDALIGIYGGVVESDQDLRTGLSQTEADGFVAGGYGAWRISALSNIASFGYVFGEAETGRAVPALSEQLQSDYDLDSFTAQGRSQYDFTVNGLLLSPYAGATFVRSDRGVVVETGGASALHVSDQSESFLFFDVGSAIEKQFSINERTKARAAFIAAWRYEALGHSIEANSSIGIEGPFNLAGAAADFDRSRLVVGGDGSVDIGENISFFAKYRGEFGSDYTSNRVSGGITIQF